jgi:hypothetical protein
MWGDAFLVAPKINEPSKDQSEKQVSEVTYFLPYADSKTA